MKKLLLLSAMLFAFISMSAGIEKKEFTIEGAEGKLFAILEYPEQVQSDVKYPLVILCHGFNGMSESPMMDMLSEKIVKAGMAALRFDFNGHGKSEGLFQNMTVVNEIEDLKDVVEWSLKQPWVESVSLLGHSQGGVVVSMVAGELGDRVIKAEVLMSPAAVLREDALRGNTMGAFYDPWNIETDYIELPWTPEGQEKLRLGKEYIVTAISLPIFEMARKYDGPALVVHGIRDRVVPYSYAERYRDELTQSELKLVDKDDHMYSQTLDETTTYVVNWLKEVLKPAPVHPVRI